MTTQPNNEEKKETDTERKNTQEEKFTSLGLKTYEIIIIALLTVAYIYLRIGKQTPVVTATLGFIIALWAIMKPTEWAVEGLTLLAERIGVGTYAAGVLGSIMANLPEIILSTLLILKGQAQIGILTVLIVAGANTFLFGVVIVKQAHKKGGYVQVPATTLRYESELMTFAFITALFLFVYNFAEAIQGKLDLIEHAYSVKIPVLYSVGTVAIYISYLVFLAKDKELNPQRTPQQKQQIKKRKTLSWKNIIMLLTLGIIGIIIAGELLANGAEILLEQAHQAGTNLGEAHIALIVGLLGSIPEWAVAFKAEEDIELVFGNVLSSISATLLFMIGLISIFLYAIGANLELDSYAIVQVVLSGSILLFVNLLMKDDLKLDTFEGLSIIILQLIGFEVLLSV